MRISDWSSDVCSSDLIGSLDKTDAHPLSRFAAQRVSPAANSPRAFRIGLHRHAQTLPTGQFWTACHRFDDVEAQHQPLRFLGIDRKGHVPFRRLHSQRLQPFRKRRHAAERLRCFRSEEHTSELQSLMRISYAVFCLKKKTTITN